jgi:aromatic ring-cleaving dioxygenase
MISATFNIGTAAVTVYATATITATSASTSRTATLLVFPPGLFDLNGDGNIDILFQNAKSGLIAYWTMDGINEVTSGLIYPADPGGIDWKVVGAGDFNGDRKPDILFQNQKTGQLIYWLMNGTTLIRFGAITPDNPGSPDWQVVAIADFNGDGKVDVLFQRQSTGQLVCWFMDGTSLMRYVLLSDPGSPAWKVAATADFNRDGMPDLLFQNQQTGQLAYWLMRGTSTLTFGFLSPSAPGPMDWKIAGIGDFNRDGNPDLLFQNQKSGDLVYWLMNGTTMVTFGYLNPANPGSPDWRAAAPH